MSYLKLVITEDTYKVFELEELTEIGRGVIAEQCKQMISDIEDINRKEEE